MGPSSHWLVAVPLLCGGQVARAEAVGQVGTRYQKRLGVQPGLSQPGAERLGSQRSGEANNQSHFL